MGIKIGIIGGSGLDNLNIFTNARDTFTGTVWGEPSSPLREGEIAGIPWPYWRVMGAAIRLRPLQSITGLTSRPSKMPDARTSSQRRRPVPPGGNPARRSRHPRSVHRLHQTAENDVPRLFQAGPARPCAHGRTVRRSLRQILIDGCRKTISLSIPPEPSSPSKAPASPPRRNPACSGCGGRCHQHVRFHGNGACQ